MKFAYVDGFTDQVERLASDLESGRFASPIDALRVYTRAMDVTCNVRNALQNEAKAMIDTCQDFTPFTQPRLNRVNALFTRCKRAMEKIIS